MALIENQHQLPCFWECVAAHNVMPATNACSSLFKPQTNLGHHLAQLSCFNAWRRLTDSVLAICKSLLSYMSILHSVP